MLYRIKTHKNQTLHNTLPVIGDLELENKLILWHFSLRAMFLQMRTHVGMMKNT